ncbi:hypothetical protein [uncultured Campylobacter sp.]|uniref:hypothetical protein n=1 Tax=uncultured Campylobacter sp. TaxID=218934 RepID=UPI00261B6395|nr:hypothetical protein [uncultured Campylobacter sp.]
MNSLFTQLSPQVEILNFQTFTSEYVAQRYGVSKQTIIDHKRNHADEIVEDIHFIYELADTKGGGQEILKWTLRGIIKLGMFIRSEKDKGFRLWAEQELEKAILKQVRDYAAIRKQNLVYEGEISNLKADAELEAKKYGRKLAYYKGETTKVKNALASYRAKRTARAGFPARINGAELSALNKELTDVKHEAISHMSEVFRLRGEIEDMAGELALANQTIASQKEYIARLSSIVVQASIEQAQAPAAMRHELELLQSDLACLQNKLSAALSKLKEQSESNKLYLKDER